MLESASVRNPLDIVATAGAQHFKSALEVMLAEEQYDSIYINFVTPPFVDCESVAREIVAAAGKKPIVCNYMTDKKMWGATSKILKDGGIPCFDFAETAARALYALRRYHGIRSAGAGSVMQFHDADKAVVEQVLSAAQSAQREVLTAGEVYGIVEAYGIPVAAWGTAVNKADAIETAIQIGFPIVLKADAERIIHKSDVGGVAVNIKDAIALGQVIDDMRTRLGDDIHFFIQKFLPHHRELIIGAKAEPGVGHMIMFGLGGIFVEILKDVSFSISPVSDTEAMAMISGLKASALIDGFRGEKGINKTKTREIIQRVSQLVTDFPAIRELDLNPLFAYDNEICAVDARIIL
jgi:acetyltransferase